MLQNQLSWADAKGLLVSYLNCDWQQFVSLTA